MMETKAISLLLLRFSTGIYLSLWGLDKLINAEHAVGLSDRFYGGLLSSSALISIQGVAQVTLGLAVVLGLFRSITYWAQLGWYLVGILPIIGYILDPFGAYLVETGRLTWFPSTTLLIASWVIIVFKEYDSFSLDSKRNK